MIRKYAKTKQLNFVTTPMAQARLAIRPNRSAAHRRICIPLLVNTMPPRRHPSSANSPPSDPHSTHVSATAQLRPFDTFYTSQIQTNSLQLQRVSNAPICVSTPTRPTFTPTATTKSVNHFWRPEIHPMQRICQLRPRYDHATNAMPPGYE